MSQLGLIRGGINHVGGGDIDGAARERGDERGGDGAVVVAVGGCVGDVVILEAEFAAYVDVFDLGLIGGKGGGEGGGDVM